MLCSCLPEVVVSSRREATGKAGTGNRTGMGIGNWCMGKDDSELMVILFTNRTRDDYIGIHGGLILCTGRTRNNWGRAEESTQP